MIYREPIIRIGILGVEPDPFPSACKWGLHRGECLICYPPAFMPWWRRWLARL
jgi:hypothetical protein